jgi:hypothetical protein
MLKCYHSNSLWRGVHTLLLPETKCCYANVKGLYVVSCNNQIDPAVQGLQCHGRS